MKRQKVVLVGVDSPIANGNNCKMITFPNILLLSACFLKIKSKFSPKTFNNSITAILYFLKEMLGFVNEQVGGFPT